MKAHLYAELFPLLEGSELAELAADIKKHGQREPILLYQGLILDGRNRAKACEMAGVAPTTRHFTGDDEGALAYVVSTNVHRRHLSAGQKAIVAARLLPMYEAQAKARQGARTDLNIPANLRESEKGEAAEKAAKETGASARNVQHAKALLDAAQPEVVQAVERGTITLHAATKAAKLAPAQQRAVIERVTSGESKNPHHAMREVAQEARIAAVAAALEEDDGGVDERWTLDEADALAWLDTAPAGACYVMDPPYGLDTHRTREGGQDYADGEDYALTLLRGVVERIAAHGQPGAHVYCFTGYSHVEAFKRIMREALDVQDNPIVWVKDNHTMCSFEDWYPSKYEMILFAKVRGARRTLARCLPDVMTHGRGRETTHSAEKPVGLLQVLIEQSTVPGELVIDPFTGSGSTGVAALCSGRMFAGCEIDPQYAALARSRLGAS